MPNEIEAGRAAMPQPEISQEAARAKLAALRKANGAFDAVKEFGAKGWPTALSSVAEIAQENIRAAIALAERGA